MAGCSVGKKEDKKRMRLLLALFRKYSTSELFHTMTIKEHARFRNASAPNFTAGHIYLMFINAKMMEVEREQFAADLLKRDLTVTCISCLLLSLGLETIQHYIIVHND